MNEEESLGLGFLAFTEEERMHEERRATNIAAVRAYLEAEFPGHKVQDWHDAKGDVHGFRVRERGLADVLVSHEFLDDRETIIILSRACSAGGELPQRCGGRERAWSSW